MRKGTFQKDLVLEEVGSADPRTQQDQLAAPDGVPRAHMVFVLKCWSSWKGGPWRRSGVAAGGETHLFEPVVEVQGSARLSQPRDTPGSCSGDSVQTVSSLCKSLMQFPETAATSISAPAKNCSRPRLLRSGQKCIGRLLW